MVRCGDMKKGEVYTCDVCGLELEVKKECKCPDLDKCHTHHTNHGDVCCEFECCGKPMHRK